MTEEEKKSHFKSFGEAMKDAVEGRGVPRIPVTYTCIDCGESKVTYSSIPWCELVHTTTSCWKCKTVTTHTREY